MPVRVLVAGATGAVGTALIPALVRRGHVVAGMARDTAGLAAAGAEAVQTDALDRVATIHAVRAFAPEVVVHQLTSLPTATRLWRFDRDFELTNRLRTTGTEILLDAARASGVRRFVAQSFCGWPYARLGSAIKTESDPLDPDPPDRLRSTLTALRVLEAMVIGATDLGGTILRYGNFYGPHTHLARGSLMAEQVRKRRFPLVGDGDGVWSFVHIDDVAEATAVAVEGAATGVYNVVDDDPTPVSIWLPELSKALGAAPPRHMPIWLARMVLPEHLRIMMTEVRGGSNALFRRTFSWSPKVASWRSGFAAEFRA